ncbi:hypothetical protein [Sutterella sp.]|uniref:hypothetical protein n=1 Tax=Sutterella sp. TaxID=1981025 RepID=UPI0026DF2B26|nr:hypothetical protein [Sutterella sp.]MDO5531067.1 hypothetical protein [Sutterella sp.]
MSKLLAAVNNSINIREPYFDPSTVVTGEPDDEYRLAPDRAVRLSNPEAGMLTNLWGGLKMGYSGIEQGTLWSEMRDKGIEFDAAGLPLDKGFRRKNQALEDALFSASVGINQDSFSYDLGNLLGSVVGGALHSARGAAVAGTMGAWWLSATGAGAAAGSIVPGVGTAAGAAAGAAVSAVGTAMATAGTFDSMYQAEGGNSFRDMVQAGIDRRTAMYASSVVGLLNGGLEAGNVKVMLSPLLRPVLEYAEREITAAALRQITQGYALRTAAKAYGVNVASETATEVAQQAITMAMGEFARYISTPDRPGLTAEEVWDELSSTAVHAFRGMVLMGGLTAIPSYGYQAHRARQAEKTVEFFEKLQSSAPTIQTATDPRGMAERIVRDEGGSDVKTVYIDGKVFNQALVDNGVSREDLAKVLPDVAANLDQAVLNHADVEIPAAVYAETIAGTPLGQNLMQHVRLDPEAESYFEMRQSERVTGEMLEAMRELEQNPEQAEAKISEAEQRLEKTETDEQKTFRRELIERIKEEMRATGAPLSESQLSASARMVATIVGNTARRRGMSYQEAEKLRPRFVSRAPEGVLNQGAIAEPVTELTPAEEQILRDAKLEPEVEEDLRRQILAAHETYRPENGWMPVELSKIKKGDDGYAPEFKTSAYTFNLDDNGKALKRGTPEYTDRVIAISDGLVEEVRAIYHRMLDGDKEAANIIGQASWYKAMRSRLREEFGSAGDVLADLLGATSPKTPVRENWQSAVDIMRQLTRGNWDELLPVWEDWDKQRIATLQAISDLVDKERPYTVDANGRKKYAVSADKVKELPEYKKLEELSKKLAQIVNYRLPRKESGALYSTNSGNALRAILGHWREVRNANPLKRVGKTAPKAITFAGNLIGYAPGATIDVWAARLLQRHAGKLRVAPRAEGAVKGDLTIDEDGNWESTGQFGLGQDAMHRAAELIRADPELSQDERLRTVQDDDLQAVVWFVEKEIWTINDWTTAEGAGGSFEYEADLEGNPDREGIRNARSTLNRADSTEEERQAAREFLEAAKDRVSRYQAGISLTMGKGTQGADFIPQDADQAVAARRMRDAAVAADDGVHLLSFHANTTDGVYMGSHETSFDVELVARTGYDPSNVFRTVIDIARSKHQDSTFMSRVLKDGEKVDYLRHRPGVEIYFKEGHPYDSEYVKTLIKKIEGEGVTFYTVITDARPSADARAGRMPNATGIRFQFVPEFNADAFEGLSDQEIEAAVKAEANKYDDIVESCRDIEGITYADVAWYDTTVVFRKEYDERLTPQNVHDEGSARGEVPNLSEGGQGSELAADAAHSGEDRDHRAEGEDAGAQGERAGALPLLHGRPEHSRVEIGSSIRDGVRRAREHYAWHETHKPSKEELAVATQNEPELPKPQEGIYKVDAEIEKQEEINRLEEEAKAEAKRSKKKSKGKAKAGELNQPSIQQRNEQRYANINPRERKGLYRIDGGADLRADIRQGGLAAQGAVFREEAQTDLRGDEGVRAEEARGASTASSEGRDDARGRSEAVRNDGRGTRGGVSRARTLIDDKRATVVKVWRAGGTSETGLRGYLEENVRLSGGRVLDAATDFYELESGAKSAKVFWEKCRSAKRSQLFGACVDLKSRAELKGLRLFLSPDGQSGFALKNGDDIVSVFSKKGSQAGLAVVHCAIAAGGRRLDCFNTILPEFYGSAGFIPVARVKFDRQWAPDGWNYDLFDRFQSGEPDIVFMVYDGEARENLVTPDRIEAIDYATDYDAGEDMQVAFVDALSETSEALERTVAEASENAAPGSLQQDARGGFNTATNEISLSLNSDVSTVVHEMGHWYLENLLAAATDPNASALFREDAQTILEALGLKSVDEWNALDFEQRRPLHERFAHWAELYITTAKAPTPKTEGFFRRMGGWVIDVYRAVKSTIESRIGAQYQAATGEALPEISPEVRRVFDRMLVGEEAIINAERAEGLEPLFESKPEDMSDEEWRQIMLERDDAERAGAEKITAAHARDEKWYANARERERKKIDKQVAELRKQLREKAERKINGRKDVIAVDILKTGGKAFGIENLKLDPDKLRAAGLSERTTAKLIAMGVTKHGGLSPEQTLQLLQPFARFTNVRQMISQIAACGDKEQMIEDEITARLVAQHSELVDPASVERLITEALHNEARGRMVAHELAYLAGDKTGNSRIYRAAARRAAEQLLSRMPVRDITARRFMRAEARAAREAQEAFSKGDREAAVLAKRAQLVQHEAALLALNYTAELDNFKSLRGKVFGNNTKLAKTRDLDIVNIARYLMTNKGLGHSAKPVDGAAADEYIKNLKAHDENKFEAYRAMVKDGGFTGVMFPDMPMGEAHEFMENVRALWRQSGEARKLELDGQRLDLEEAVDALVKTAEARPHKGKIAGKLHAVDSDDKAAFGLRGIAAQLVRVENLCRWFDGGTQGAFTNYIFRPIVNATARYRVKNNELQKQLADLIEPMHVRWELVRNIEAPEINYTFRNKAELIAAILHTGNASNKRKLLLGGRGKDRPWGKIAEDQDGNPTGELDSSAWDNFIARMYREGYVDELDMDFVQAVWDTLESTKHEAQVAYRKMFGRYFQEIEATEIETPWGTYRGGYVPAVTDHYLVDERSRQEEIERALSQDTYLKVMPVNDPGFAQSRVEGYNRPLALDIGSLTGHVQKVLKFSIIGPAAQEVSKVVQNREFREAVNLHGGHFLDKVIEPWIKRSYEQSISDGKVDEVSSALNRLRSLAGMNIMVGHIINALQQSTGLSIAAALVGSKEIAHAFSAYIRFPGKTLQEIADRSPFMKARLEDRSFEYESQTRRAGATDAIPVKEARGAFNKVAALDAKLEPARAAVGRLGYFLQSAMQKPIDGIVWTAGYNKAIREGMSEQDAVAEADALVRRTQSDFSPENLSEVETGSALYRAFLVFYNYFNMQLNLLAERGMLARETKQYGRFAKEALLISWVPSVLSAVILRMIVGGWDTDDDDDWDAYDALQLFVGEPLKGVIAMAPFIGSGVNSVAAYWANDDSLPLHGTLETLWGKDPYVGRVMSSPAVDLVVGAAGGVATVARTVTGEEQPNARTAMRNFLDLLSVVLRLPVGALKKEAGYMAGVYADEIHPENAGDFVQGLLRGRGED